MKFLLCHSYCIRYDYITPAEATAHKVSMKLECYIAKIVISLFCVNEIESASVSDRESQTILKLK